MPLSPAGWIIVMSPHRPSKEDHRTVAAHPRTLLSGF